MSHPTQSRSFQRQFSQPITWLHMLLPHLLQWRWDKILKIQLNLQKKNLSTKLKRVCMKQKKIYTWLFIFFENISTVSWLGLWLLKSFVSHNRQLFCHHRLLIDDPYSRSSCKWLASTARYVSVRLCIAVSACGNICSSVVCSYNCESFSETERSINRR